jgi:alkylation response protein AidB-like acyl-CoA dehydrogenase
VNRTETGRSLLRAWEDARPANFYTDDDYLRATLGFRLGSERLARLEPALAQAGEDSAGPINVACGVVDRPENLPRLERWNGIGERTEDIVFHPAYHEIGRLVWRSGVLAVLGEPGRMLEHAALTYVFAQNGEGAHLCAVACTAGLVKALQRSGSEEMRRTWLPRLVAPDYAERWHGAQFLTEVQGGSDVGANACLARPVDGRPGLWRLHGEKWFCSNVSADLYAVSARAEHAADGTAGVGLFVVPRRLDGRPNAVLVRRLKNKLGTRTLPTAEVDFDGALAWQLGPLEDGFKLMMGVIINTSRLEVAIGCAGMMRRAFVDALRYARVREAFGRRLVDFPAVRHQLAEMRALTTAAVSSTLFVADLEDRLTRAGAPAEDDPLFRTVVNVNKYACSIDAGLVVHHAIEVLGGNGTIEDFSVLPRLYREVPVQESWEGPHNTLMAQILRDALRAKMHGALFARASDALLAVDRPDLAATRDAALARLEDVRGRLETLLRATPDVAALHVRALVGQVARLFQVALLLEQAARDPHTPAAVPAIARFLLKRLGGDVVGDPEYPGLIDAVLG